ncbi:MULTISPECIES: YggT family protein [Giesbergeria]|uniref:YggT family protein n=1 Tax=Giesbergeria sinuosa TaxID=80883 RepID=A0ABV9QC19_9BURK
MLYQIVSFLLDVAAGLLCGACLLRLYMQWQRIPFGNPVGQMVFALSDWLILPLRKVIPPLGRIDTASLLAAALVELLQYLLLWLLLGAGAGLLWLPWLALFGLVRVALTGMTGLIIIHAVMSWVQTRSVLADVIDRLSEPLLRPLRRLMPLVGGVDFAPLVLLVLLQVAVMVLGYLQAGVLR